MITLVELVVLAAAGYRATQLAVNDSILDPARDRVHAWHQARPHSPTRTAVITLISCVYCTGWWLSGAILAAYLTAARQWGDALLLVHGIEWFAVAGAAALANRLDGSFDRAAS